MFSGIVETTALIKAAEKIGAVTRIQIERPKSFIDLHIGDSICTDGVCLTVEEFDLDKMIFALGPETLKITGWDTSGVLNRAVNLERSLRLQDRIHGHLVTGHVDTTGTLSECARHGETQFMRIEFPSCFAAYVWAKGSIAINGVSLTINEALATSFTVGLIPETLKRTNLGQLKNGDKVNLEIDNMARGLIHFARLEKEMK